MSETSKLFPIPIKSRHSYSLQMSSTTCVYGMASSLAKGDDTLLFLKEERSVSSPLAREDDGMAKSVRNITNTSYLFLVLMCLYLISVLKNKEIHI